MGWLSCQLEHFDLPSLQVMDSKNFAVRIAVAFLLIAALFTRECVARDYGALDGFEVEKAKVCHKKLHQENWYEFFHKRWCCIHTGKCYHKRSSCRKHCHHSVPTPSPSPAPAPTPETY